MNAASYFTNKQASMFRICLSRFYKPYKKPQKNIKISYIRLKINITLFAISSEPETVYQVAKAALWKLGRMLNKEKIWLEREDPLTAILPFSLFKVHFNKCDSDFL